MKQVKNAKNLPLQVRKKINNILTKKKVAINTGGEEESKKENEYIKMLYKISPLFVSASSWLIINIDHERPKFADPKVQVKSPKKKCQIRLSLTDWAPADQGGNQWRNYYNRDLNMKQEFFDGKNSHFMLQKDCHSKREIASLTKIMTWYTVLRLIDKFKLNKATELVCVSKEASSVIGTTAELKESDLLSVWDLLHGMMLPSGNDAAHALAEHFGELLLRDTKHTTRTLFYSSDLTKRMYNN